MKIQITLKSGAQIHADVEDLTTGRNALTNALQSLKWTTPADWLSKLYTVEVDDISAIVLIRDQLSAADGEETG